MGQAYPKPALRPMLPQDAPVLAAIFCESIDVLTEEDYSENQREAWMAMADDEAAFARHLAGQLTLVATVGDSPVGFASLKDNRHIDMLYVHPHVVRQGVATVLVDALEKLAAARGAKQVAVDASDTARPFFVKRGYRDEQRNTITLAGEWLGNTSMVKDMPVSSGNAGEKAAP